MRRILFLETDPGFSQQWRTRLESFGFSVDVIGNDDDWELQQPLGKYPLAILRATHDEGEMTIANGLLRERAASVMAIAENDDPRLHQIAYQSGMEDCLNESVDHEALGRKIQRAIQLHQLHHDLVQSQKLQSIGQLAAGIAHEINTPIQYVGDNTRFFGEACDDYGLILDSCNEVIELLESGQDPAAAVVRLRERMKTADLPYLRSEVPSAIGQTIDGIDRVAAIVRAIKTYAHSASPEPIPTDLSAAIQTTVTLCRNEWKYVSNVELSLDKSLTDVPCIEGQINQVVLNLIVNAAHAIEDRQANESESGYSTISRIAKKGVIKISTERLDASARIRISDNGGGIPPDVIERIYDPFFTTKEAGKGTGQGLSIAREIVVDAHGGQIDVSTEVGQGTTFVLDLPLASQPGHESKAVNASEQRTQEVSK